MQNAVPIKIGSQLGLCFSDFGLGAVYLPLVAALLVCGISAIYSLIAVGRAVPLAPVTRVLVIDNYDSFVYNLVQYLGQLGADPTVVRNDDHSVDALMEMQPDAVLISPGPGRPDEAGVSIEAIQRFGEGGTPVLGVCLGHQCIGQIYGATVTRAPAVMHGKTSEIRHSNVGVFAGLDDPFVATRYHSLVVERSTIGAPLEITAESEDGLVMGLRHQDLPIEGVQFHPESILTAGGHALLTNFLKRAGA